MRRYVRKVYGVDDDAEVGPRQAKIFAAIEGCFDHGPGADLPSVTGTVWTAYNAVNEYLTYERGRNQDTRLCSLWFGQAGQMDRRALALAIEFAMAA